MKNSLLSTTDVAALLKVNESTVKRWTEKGTLRCFKTHGGHRKYTRKDVAEFIERFGFEVDESAIRASAPQPGVTVSTDYAILTKNFALLAGVLKETLLRADEDGAYDFLRLLRSNRYTLPELYDQVVGVALRQIGAMWVERTVSIEQEHIATNCMLSALRLLQHDIPKKPLNNRTVICGCFEGEFHEVGITCVRNMLDAEGWTTYYLGPNLPVESFIQALERYTPDLVCVSATTPKVKTQFRKDCALLHAAAHRMGAALLVGGAATMQGGASKIAADFIPKSVAETLLWTEAHYRNGIA